MAKTCLVCTYRNSDFETNCIRCDRLLVEHAERPEKLKAQQDAQMRLPLGK